MCLFSVIVSIFFIFPFFKKEENKRSEEKSSYYPIYVHQIQDRIGEIVKKQYQLNCCAVGGSMPDDVQSIKIEFQSKKPATVDEARVLMVEILQIFHKEVNQHKNVRPFLREYPFSISRLKLAIHFDARYFGEKEVESVDHVFMSQTGIYYGRRGKTFEDRIELLEETYEEAVKKYNNV